MNEEQRARLADHRNDFTFLTSDREIQREEYSEGRYVQRSMRRSNRSRKTDKQWRTTSQERAVLRYTTGG